MIIPSKLRILLMVWIAVGILWIATFGLIILLGVVQILFVKQSLPAPYSILLLFLLLIFVFAGWYIIKICKDLWRGRSSAEVALRIFAGINILSFPFGTALGIITFIILSSETVQTFLNKGRSLPTKEDLLKDIAAANLPPQDKSDIGKQ